MSGGGAARSLVQRAASTKVAGRRPWWCFWCKQEPLLGGVPARCDMGTPYQWPFNGHCYKYNCEPGFDPVKDTDIDCEQKCWGERNVKTGPVCGRSPEEASQIAATLALTAARSGIEWITVGFELEKRGLSTDMAVYGAGSAAWTPLITSFLDNRDCPLDPK